MKRQLKPLLMLLVLLVLAPSFAWAGSAPYDTRTAVWQSGAWITKDAYLPVRTMEKFSEAELKNPSDIAISKEGILYIADTGNTRILKIGRDGSYIGEIGNDILKQPKGVFVNDEGQVYVADPKEKAVFLFEKDGSLLHKYERPTDVIYGQSVAFTPSKVVADKAGNVYVLADGNASGIIQLSKAGDFFGYVGANKTPLTLMEMLRRVLSTDAQQAQMKLNAPAAPMNMAIDERGLIYTVTQGSAMDGLKKFNMAGVNMFEEAWVDSMVAAMCISPLGNIYTVSADGYIAEYTSDGDFLYLFAGRDDGYNRNGLFVAAAGICMDAEGCLYVLDTSRKNVTVFEPTEYANTLHQAWDLYQKGRYAESREPWGEILKQDAMFGLAYQGIGEAYYKLEMYDEAMAAFRQSDYKSGYSEAFWEIRNTWMMNHLAGVFCALAVLLVIIKAIKMTNRKWGYLKPLQNALKAIGNVKIIKQITFMGNLPKNPADAFYGIRHEGKVSILSSTIMYVLFFLVYLLEKYASAFLFKWIRDGYFEFGTDFATVFGGIALAVICINLICSISDGEGRMRDMYCGFAYCLMPFICLKPVMVALSYVLTENEAFIIHFGHIFIVASVLLLIIIMVKEIQVYTYKKTFKCLLLTLCTMAMLIVTGVIIFTLISQVVDFVSSIFREVYFRAS